MATHKVELFLAALKEQTDPVLSQSIGEKRAEILLTIAERVLEAPMWVEGTTTSGELRTWAIAGDPRPRVCEFVGTEHTLYVALDDASVYAELVDAQARAEAIWAGLA